LTINVFLGTITSMHIHLSDLQHPLAMALWLILSH
jgi:hypothetical protein